MIKKYFLTLDSLWLATGNINSKGKDPLHATRYPLHAVFLHAIRYTLYAVFVLHGIAIADANILNLRIGHHPEFLRIVLEGPEPIISKGIVKQKKNNILVTFSTPAVVQAKRVSIPYKTANDQITFSPGKFSRFKSYILENPSRLIIDVYQDTKSKLPSTPSISMKRGHGDVKIQENPPHHAPRPPLSKTHSADLASGRRTNAETSMSQGDTKTQNPKHETQNQSLTVTQFDPAHRYKANADMSGIEYLTQEYIHADTEDKKAAVLLKRGEIYQKMGFFYEAKANYVNLLKNHPTTRYTPHAYLSLAKTLEQLGRFDDAIEHYEKVVRANSHSPIHAEALYGRANALQKIGRTQDAYKAYADAMNIDKTYPENSAETQYLIGENLRLMGKKEEARQYLLKVQGSRFKVQDSAVSNSFNDNASISLGLIALDEGNLAEAIKYLSSVSSRDRKLKGMAMLYLAKALSESGKSKEAVSTLDEIRHSYPYTAQYSEATLELSKIYKNEGRLNESISLLRELLNTRHIPDEAVNELQTVLLETAQKDNAQFVKLWKEYGRRFFHPSREQFLLDIAETVKDRDAMLDLYKWLAENASEAGRAKAAAMLAGFYVDMEKPEAAKGFLTMAKKATGNKQYFF